MISSNTSSYRPDIDGLRAIAVLAVVGFHAFPGWIKGGFVGVDIFFVVSGFLITGIIIKSLDEGSFGFWDFYSRRIRRIFPALFICLVAIFVFGWFALLGDEFKSLRKHIFGGAAFVSNFFYWQESGYFDTSAETKPLLHLWSLGIEEQFYIIFPLLLYFIWKYKIRIIPIITFLFVLSFFCNIFLYKQYHIADFYSPLSRFWELLCGALLAVAKQQHGAFWGRLTLKIDSIWARVIFTRPAGNDGQTLLTTLSCLGFICIVVAIFATKEGRGFPGYQALLPVAGTMLILLAGQRSILNRKIFSQKLAVGIGLISYPLYLWHWPILSYLNIIHGENPSRIDKIVAVLAATIFAWLTYYIVENPIRHGKRAKNAKAIILAILIAGIGCVGAYTYVMGGLPTRNFISAYEGNINELQRLPAQDDSAIEYTGFSKDYIPYCRYENVSSTTTYAVIGDSHAHAAYPGIAHYLHARGINTLLLALSGNVPFVGSEKRYSDKATNDRNKITANKIIDFVATTESISKVFIITRGRCYLTGQDSAFKEKINDVLAIRNDVFRESLQETVRILTEHGKLVYIVSENPELPFHPGKYLSRPLRKTPAAPVVTKEETMQKQAEYLKILNSIRGATLINALEAFCPTDKCLFFSKGGKLLYADDDHLSGAGSAFQVEHLLKPYLDEQVSAYN